MKKLLSIMLLLMLIISLASCGKGASTEELEENEMDITAEENTESLSGDSVLSEAEDTEDAKDDETADLPEESNLITLSPFSGWTTDLVNFRAGSSTESEIIAVLKRNTKVTVKGQQENFYFVETESGEEGFISMDYLTDIEPQNNGYIICIDPGHQRNGDSKTEPNGPGSSSMKARVTGGATGTTTGVTEYNLNLDVSLKLRDELESRGYTVYMTRETNDVNISNMERAQYAASVGADITVRIHANSADSSSTNGALVLVPSSKNPYVSNLSSESKRLGQCILNAYCEATGFKKLSVQENDTMTGINWCTMPVTILEMGFMSNPSDDTAMQDPSMQSRMVQGIADGIDNYFGQ